MRKPDLLLDVDGVVADLNGATLAALEVAGLPLEKQKIVEWDLRKYMTKEQKEYAFSLWDSDGWADSLPLYPGAKEAVKKLKKIANIHFLTSHWDSSKSWVHDRTNWLIRNFGVTSKDMTFSHSKYKTHGDIFVDDHVKNLGPWRDKWIATGGLPYLWRQYYNETMPWDGNSLRNWNELETLVLNWEHFRDLHQIVYLKSLQK